jgi:hypothetical protein
VTFGVFLSEELLPSKSFKGDQRCFLFRCQSFDPKDMHLNESEILQRRERTRNYVTHSAQDIQHSKSPRGPPASSASASDSLFDSNSAEYQSRNAVKLTPAAFHHSNSTPSASPHHLHSTPLSPLSPPHPPPSPLSPTPQSTPLSAVASRSGVVTTPSSLLSPERDSVVSSRRLRGLPNIEFEAFHWKSGNQRRFQQVDSSGLHFGSALWIGIHFILVSLCRFSDILSIR